MRGHRDGCFCLAVSESESDTCGLLRDLDSSIGVPSGPEGAGGGRSVLEAVSWVSVVIVASLAGGVVSVDNCRSGAGCTGFESCSISVEVVGVSLGVVSGSERGGGRGGGQVNR